MTTTTQVRSSRRALAALSLPVLMASLDTSIANTALPTIAHALSVPFAAVQWIVLTYLLALTPLLVVAGRLGDRFGRRRVLEAGVAGFTAASLACGLAPSLAVLLVARTVQGMGAAAMLTMGLAFAGDVATAGRAGRVMGLLGTMSALGTAAGPALGALLATHFGWHALFLVNVPVGLVILVLVRRSLAADPERTPDRASALDLPGTLLLATALVAYALAMTPQGSRTTPGTLAFAGLAVAGALAFVRLQARATTPLVALELFRDRVFAFGLVSSALVSAVIMSTLVVGPFHLARGLGVGATGVGALLSIGPLVVAALGAPAGWLAEKFGTRATALAGLVLMVLSSLALAVVPRAAGVPGYLLPIVCLTAGYALFQTANNTSLLSGVTAAHRGTGAGLVQLSRNLGLITGASVLGTVFAHGVGPLDATAAAPGAIARGTHLVFAVAAALTAAALLLALAARSRPSHAGAPP